MWRLLRWWSAIGITSRERPKDGSKASDKWFVADFLNALRFVSLTTVGKLSLPDLYRTLVFALRDMDSAFGLTLRRALQYEQTSKNSKLHTLCCKHPCLAFATRLHLVNPPFTLVHNTTQVVCSALKIDITKLV